MTALLLQGGTTGLASDRLMRHVTPETVAANAKCDGLWLARPEYCTLAMGTNRIMEIRNLADPANPMVSTLGQARSPALVNDTQLNRNVADFPDDYSGVMLATNPVNYRDQFTIGVAFRAQINSAKLFETLIGRYDPDDNDRAYLALTGSGNITAVFGDGSPGISAPYVDDTWTVALMAYNGINQLSLSVNGGAWQDRAIAAEPAVGIDQLRLGFNADGGATTRGLIDMATVWNKSLASTASASDLAEFMQMLRAYYSPTIEV
ncbi:MAG: LamG-like jellyroll fold domain-containing protein [Pseudomonadota bacterium]